MSEAPGRRSELVALGEVIRTVRLDDGLTAAEVADAAGITPRYLSKLERGGGNPSIAVLLAIAEVLGAPASTLLKRAEADAGD